MDDLTLQGASIRLEPLEHRHIDELVAAAAEDPPLYRWSPTPQGQANATRYVETAMAWRDEGSAVPFAIVRLADDVVVGSTRFFNLERWAWPPGHPSHGRAAPDVGEIGYTWLGRSAIRTPANTEAKLLMLGHAFDVWQVHRVGFQTDERNTRSRKAIERIGGRLDGLLRADQPGTDNTVRTSARFSILASEWPEVKERLTSRLGRGAQPVEG